MKIFLYRILIIMACCLAAGPAVVSPAAAETVFDLQTLSGPDWGRIDGAYWLALDSRDNPRIVYRQQIDEEAYALVLAAFDGTAWTFQAIDQTTTIAPAVFLALDDLDQAHVCYAVDIGVDGQAQWQVRYAAFDGAAWVVQNMDAVMRTSGKLSLALDSQKRPNIAYETVNERSQTSLIWYRFDGLAWTGVAFNGALGYHSSLRFLALDSLDAPHLSHDKSEVIDYSRSAYFLQYSSYTGQEWFTETPDPLSDCGGFSALVLDDQDLPHIIYDGSWLYRSYPVNYTHFDGQAWTVSAIDTLEKRVYARDLALTGAGAPAAVYYSPQAELVRYAALADQAWTAQDLAVGPRSLTARPSLAFDSQDRPWVLIEQAYAEDGTAPGGLELYIGQAPIVQGR